MESDATSAQLQPENDRLHLSGDSDVLANT